AEAERPAGELADSPPDRFGPGIARPIGPPRGDPREIEGRSEAPTGQALKGAHSASPAPHDARRPALTCRRTQQPRGARVLCAQHRPVAGLRQCSGRRTAPSAERPKTRPPQPPRGRVETTQAPRVGRR
ncbi:MAG: hypothetical protein ACK56I_13285, partial [bacterium]